MIQTKLIDLTEMKKYHDISDTTYTKVLDSMIVAAQLQDVAGLLGERLFNEVLNDAPSYASLLDGGTYVYQGITYTNYGLKAVISHYAYARYLFFGSSKDTPFGFVEKLSGQDSRPVSDKTKKDLYTLNRDSAYKLWISVENFLVRTNEPLFKNKCNTKPNNQFRISKIV